MVASLVVLFHVPEFSADLFMGWLALVPMVRARIYVHAFLCVCVCACVCVCVFGNMGSDSGALFTHLTEFLYVHVYPFASSLYFL